MYSNIGIRETGFNILSKVMTVILGMGIATVVTVELKDQAIENYINPSADPADFDNILGAVWNKVF